MVIDFTAANVNKKAHTLSERMAGGLFVVFTL